MLVDDNLNLNSQNMTFIMIKKKKYKFQVDLKVEELSSVPLVNAVLFTKVRLLDGGSFTDTSSREEVMEHCVKWNAHFNFMCKMSASANTGLLDPCTCRVSIRKELKGGRSFQKLGFADINLAEFAGSGTMSRCFLLEGYYAKHRQDNSTLKVTIVMTLLSGDPCFKVPSTRPLSLPGEVTEEQLPMERRGEENSGGGSLTSGSSGIGSLPRKHRPNVLTSDLVSGNTTTEPTEIGGRLAPTAVTTTEDFELTHSRNSSYTSQQSKASGYSSMHSRQSSSESGHASSNPAPLTEVNPPKWNLSSGSNDPATLAKAERKRKQILEDPKESRVDSTRVNAKDLINELVESANLSALDSAEPEGLQLYVLKDGTATLGSHDMQSQVASGNYEPVVFDNR